MQEIKMSKAEAYEIVRMLIQSFLGLPYNWGGDDPIKGFDCSGFCIELLKSVCLLPAKGDWTAHMLYQTFANHIKSQAQFGCLVFYGQPKRVTHVEFCYNEQVSVGASGGGKETLTQADAISQNAYIKIRSIYRRSDVVAVVDPFDSVRWSGFATGGSY